MILCLLVTTALAVPPSYLVERVVLAGAEKRRVSVFRDGWAVSVSEGPGRPRQLVRQRLDRLELQVVAQVVDECYEELAQLEPPEEAPGGAWVELRLAPSGKLPLILRLPLAGMRTPASERLGQALDGVETRLLAVPKAREDLHAWQPEAGEKAELDDGQIVEVLELQDSPAGVMVRVRYGDSPALGVLSLDELRARAVRRITR